MTRFGTFEIDLRARAPGRGIRIRLQDQPFEILAMMLDRPGEVVTRDELRQRLWPAGTFVDFEHSLNAAVKRLRAALGDDADNPRFVETLHRRGYRFIAPVESKDNGSTSTAAPPRATLRAYAEAPAARLVVLPFANLSNDPAQEYFSDGLTEEMIAQISRLFPNKLGVIARTSSMRFKHSGKSASEIGQELSVDYLLEGSVRREGDRVRITAQLIETRTETHLWAETYDRLLEESLLLQSDVAARIAQSLTMELVLDGRDTIARAPAAGRGVSGVPSRDVFTGTAPETKVSSPRSRTTSARWSSIPAMRPPTRQWRALRLRSPIFPTGPAGKCWRARDGGPALPGAGSPGCPTPTLRWLKSKSLDWNWPPRKRRTETPRALPGLRPGAQLLLQVPGSHVAAR
jgi:TolB-like protein